MAISPDLLEILRCPETRTPLTVAGEDLIAQLNEKVAKGEVKNKEGEAVGEALGGGLIREEGDVLYPVRDDIPVMLIGEGILLEPLGLKA